MSEDLNEYPLFLHDYGRLLSHFNSHFEGLTSFERGERFVQFVKKLIPHSTIGERFEIPKLRPRSHDQGVDLECESRDRREKLCIQSKYTIRGVDDFDEIISKFKDYQQLYYNEIDEARRQPKQLGLLGDGFISQEAESFPTSLRFMIVTASDLTGVVPRYEQSSRPSLEFYNELKAQETIHLLDGPQLVPLLQKAYRKLHILPTNFALHFANDFIHLNDVYIGVVSSLELKRLYDEFGDALFLENIREFLGIPSDRSSLTDVNKEILRTLEDEPDKFLAKNNGIAFRAGSISSLDSQTLSLTEASIVNGFQTTRVVVQQPDENCYVLAKVVGTEHSWEIAKAANFQNQINRIDLDLAEYIRPRDVRIAASTSGIGFQYQQGVTDSVFAVLDVIYHDQISYKEMRSLFIGLFSRNPNNAIDPDYGQLRTDIIDELYRFDPRGQETFGRLFSIQRLTQKAAQEAQETFSGQEHASMFQRFWEEAKPRYRAFLSILSVSGCVRQNIYAAKDELDFPKMLNFLESVERIVQGQPEIFIRYFRNAFKTVANQIIATGQERSSALQRMTTLMHRVNFDSLYRQLCLNADDDDILRAMIKPTNDCSNDA